MLSKIVRLLPLLLLLLLGGCLSEEEETVFGLYRSPENLDPQLAVSDESTELIELLFPQLLTLQDGALIPEAAESWTAAENGLRYDFIIREDLTWSDGEPLTAEDFAFAIRRILDPATGSPYREVFSAVNFVGAEQGRLTIWMKEPDNRLPYLLSMPAASPCRSDFLQDTHGRYGLEREYLLAGGDFYLSSWNDEYLRLRSRVDETVLRFDLGGEAGYNEKKEAIFGILFNQADPLFAEVGLRQAIALDLPAEELPTRFFETPIGEYMLVDPDPEKAATQFHFAASQSGGDIYGRTLLIPEECGLSDDFALLSQVWQRDLGLYLAVEQLPMALISERIAEGDYDCALTPLDGLYDHPSGILSVFYSDAADNPCRFTDTAFDDMLKQASKESGSPADSLYLQAGEYLLEQTVWLPLYTAELPIRQFTFISERNP